MADDASNSQRPFDVRTIRNLVALMSRHNLREIDLREGDLRIRLRRGPDYPSIPPAEAAPPPVTAASIPAAPATPAANAEPARPAKAFHEIKSPTVGTFYDAPKAGADPFVRVGSRVTPTTVVCLVEAMKLFNEVQAECSGVITEILAANQEAVEYGQVLFKVDTTA